MVVYSFENFHFNCSKLNFIFIAFCCSLIVREAVGIIKFLGEIFFGKFL